MTKWKGTNNDSIDKGSTIQWLNEKVQTMIALTKDRQYNG
jgi:hypothetical protein